jgi:hypothetical protein
MHLYRIYIHIVLATHRSGWYVFETDYYFTDFSAYSTLKGYFLKCVWLKEIWKRNLWHNRNINNEWRNLTGVPGGLILSSVLAPSYKLRCRSIHILCLNYTARVIWKIHYKMIKYIIPLMSVSLLLLAKSKIGLNIAKKEN